MTMFRGESWEISPGRGRNKHLDAVFWGDFSCFSWEKRDKKGRGPGRERGKEGMMATRGEEKEQGERRKEKDPVGSSAYQNLRLWG